jgi:hypothetical protein
MSYVTIYSMSTGPVFWNLTSEIYTAIAEGMNDLLMLVGRPTVTVDSQFNLTPNTVWQHIPKGLFLITDVMGPQSALHRVSLFDMDYVQSSWSSSWECDTSPNGPTRWFPVGMTMFGVHPAPSVPFMVTMNAIAYPVAQPWPYNANIVVPFEHHWFEALEEYAAHYLRLKEGGAEFQNSMSLYAAYLSVAERMTTIQDRRDQLLFSRSFGAIAGLSPLTRR